MTDSREHYHFVGVGGVGMSALAAFAASGSCDVSGSDRHLDRGKDTRTLRVLARIGVRLVPQDGSAVTANTTAVVISTAIEADNPELTAARTAGVPVWHRSEMLARLTTGKDCVAITGTCGKSTVTGMTGWILECAGEDPSVVCGAEVVNWSAADCLGSMRTGAGALCVIEADESDRSLLNYHPEWAVVTNASADHFSLEETLALFERFEKQVLGEVVNPLRQPELIDGFSPVTGADGVRFAWRGEDLFVPLLGKHNAENALLAAEICGRIGVKPQTIREALASFRGLRRRLEVMGAARGVTVIDDYAHNPAKIGAAWEALAPHFGKIVAIWRPHGFGPLKNMMRELAETFMSLCGTTDRLFVLPVYDEGGTADRSVSAEDLVAVLQEGGVPAQAWPEAATLATAAASEAVEGDAVLVMGARDPGLPELARAVLRELESGTGRCAQPE